MKKVLCVVCLVCLACTGCEKMNQQFSDNYNNSYYNTDQSIKENVGSKQEENAGNFIDGVNDFTESLKEALHEMKHVCEDFFS